MAPLPYKKRLTVFALNPPALDHIARKLNVRPNPDSDLRIWANCDEEVWLEGPSATAGYSTPLVA